jgi:hypothetical protein
MVETMSIWQKNKKQNKKQQKKTPKKQNQTKTLSWQAMRTTIITLKIVEELL